MKILIIGGAGFLGLNIANSLNRCGHRIYLYDRSVQSARTLFSSGEFVDFFEGDCDSPAEILKIIDLEKIECVINLASSLLPASNEHDFNVELCGIMAPGFHLLNEIAHRNIKYVYVSSGGAVYGPSDKSLIEENDPKKPINFYGLSKLLFEEYITFISRTAGLNYLILRPSNPYGPHQNPNKKQGLIAVVADKVMRGDSIEIWGDGSIIRDYVWVEDLAGAVNELLKRNEWNQEYNIGAGVGHSIGDVIHVIEEVSGNTAKCIYKQGRAVDAPRIVLDISKIQSAVDFKPISLKDGIQNYMKGMRIAAP